MKDIMKLNGTQIEIETGAVLSNIVHLTKDEAAALKVCELIMDAELTSVEFYTAGEKEPYGVYTDLKLLVNPIRQKTESGEIAVIISLAEKTEIEKRVDNLEKTTDMLIMDALV